MEQIIIDSLGWIGAVFYLLAYYLVSTKKLTGDATSYQIMNLVGGITLTINTFYYHTLPAMTVNLAWIGISVFILGRVWLVKR